MQHGTLTLGSLAGVTVTGDGTGSVTITGSPAAITAALDGLQYASAPDYNGADTLSVVSTDGVATTYGKSCSDRHAGCRHRGRYDCCE